MGKSIQERRCFQEISERVVRVASDFRVGDLSEGTIKLGALMDDFDKMVSYLQDIGVDISGLNVLYTAVFNSLENHDYVSVSDILEFEIRPIVNELINALQEE